TSEINRNVHKKRISDVRFRMSADSCQSSELAAAVKSSDIRNPTSDISFLPLLPACTRSARRWSRPERLTEIAALSPEFLNLFETGADILLWLRRSRTAARFRL